MKSKNKIAGALTLGLVIVAGIYLNRDSTSDGLNLAIGTEPFDSLPAANVKGIVIRTSPTNSLTLRQVDGQWRIKERGDYPADKSMVDSFILNFQNMKVLRSISATEGQLPTLNLLPPTNQTATSETAVRVELQDAQGKQIHSALLGKESSGPPALIPSSVPMADRRFLMIDDNPKSIIVVDQTFSTAETNPQDWLNKDFLKIENPTRIAVTFPGNSTDSWRISEQDNNGTMEWKLADHNASVKLDTNVAPISAFSSPSFEDVVAPSQAVLLDTNATRIEMVTRDGLQYAFAVKSLGKDKDGNDEGYLFKMDVNATFAPQRVPAKGEKPADKAALDADWAKQQKELQDKLNEQKKFSSRVYQVPAHVVNNVIKKRAELIASDPPPPFNPTPGGLPGPLLPPNFPPNPRQPDNLE